MKGKAKITIQGHLDKKCKNSFQGMKISYEGDNTILTGDIKRRNSYAWSFNILRDLNIKLISIHPAE